jgi:hypothetical protein
MNDGVVKLFRDYNKTDDIWTSTSEMALRVDLEDMLDFNGNGQFDPDSEAFVQTTNLVEWAFIGWDGGGGGWATDSYSYSVIAETTNGTPWVWLDDYDLTTDTTDPDNDGFQTLEEYICGTNPTNAASFFAASIASDGVSFPTLTNRLYDVEGCGRLGDPSNPSNVWKNVVTNLPGSGNPITVPFDTNHFYRVKVSLP